MEPPVYGLTLKIYLCYNGLTRIRVVLWCGGSSSCQPVLFFGHHDCPDAIKPKLRESIVNLIENHTVDRFYVGQQGNFDAIVRSVLRELISIYPHITYAVVLERMPLKRSVVDNQDYSDTILPEGIETVHPRFAISWRNRWMIERSDYVVAYVTHSWGGATQFAELAKRQKKVVIQLT